MVMLRPVEKMKDSGIEWIGNIPEEWKIIPVFALLDEPDAMRDGPFGSDLKNEEYTDTGVPVVQLGAIQDGKFEERKLHFITENKANSLIRHNAFPHDIVIAKMMPAGKAAILPEKFDRYVVSADVIKATIAKDAWAEWLIYALNSYGVIQCETQSQGATRSRININKAKRIKIAFPNDGNVTGILHFLDDRCSKLDEIITEAEKSIEEYKELKQAVIDETVSLGCSRIRVKYIGSVQTGPFGTQLSADEYTMEGIPCINVKNIGYGYIKNDNLDYLPEMVADRLSDHKLLENDIVFARKGSIDKHAIVSNRECGWVQGSDCIRLRINTSIISAEYLNYYIASTEVNKYLWLKSNGSTMPSLNSEMIKNIPIEVPDMKRQKVIVVKLREKLQAIDAIIAQKQSLIEDLKAYKKSLIYEVVTGKRRVV